MCPANNKRMAKQDLLLLALDASQILDLMQRALHGAGYKVAVAHTAEAMAHVTQESVPALVILGEQLGGQPGAPLAEDLLERFPTLPIILYANSDKHETVKAAFKAGFMGYLTPPLKMDDIVAEVERALQRARQLGDWLRREVKRTTASLAEKAKISEAEKAKMEAILSNIQDGVIVLDDNHRILMVNHAVREIFHLNGRELNGKILEEAIPNADLLALINRSSSEPLKYHEVNFDDGRVYNAQYAPIPSVGAAVSMQDISYLKELDRLKSDFIHTVSHDLRSPLTAVLGYAELIERTGPLNENQQEFLRRLQGSIHHITSLVNDLLDLGRLESGFDTRREMVMIDDVLKYALDMFDSEIQKKQIRLTTNIDPEIQPLRANPIRIRQMIDNLVGNAIKYTPQGGRVRVDLFMQDNQIIFKVTDSGPGIPPEEHSRVFEKFFRASNAPDGVQGSGLGLAIVKSIVESHQGRVWVESEVGKGSAFTVILPPQE